MNRFFDSLNLRPYERRLIVIAGLIVFILLNFWFIWPLRNSWKTEQTAIRDLRDRLTRYENAAARLESVKDELMKLESEGSTVIAEGEVDLIKTVQSKIYRAGLPVNRMDPSTSRGGTNDFFIEKTLVLQYDKTRDTNLVNFLISLGQDDSLIRVRDLTIRTDPQRQTLLGRISLVASYQREKSRDESTTNRGFKTR